jgi:hypothetical protein
MKRILVALALTASAMTAATWNATPASAASCGSGEFCVWTAENYTGTVGKFTDQPNGTCVQLWDRRYSFQNNSSSEGYFYRYGDCTGQVRAAVRGAKVPKMGFPATGFKYACVSCRE